MHFTGYFHRIREVGPTQEKGKDRECEPGGTLGWFPALLAFLYPISYRFHKPSLLCLLCPAQNCTGHSASRCSGLHFCIAVTNTHEWGCNMPCTSLMAPTGTSSPPTPTLLFPSTVLQAHHRHTMDTSIPPLPPQPQSGPSPG